MQAIHCDSKVRTLKVYKNFVPSSALDRNFPLAYRFAKRQYCKGSIMSSFVFVLTNQRQTVKRGSLSAGTLSDAPSSVHIEIDVRNDRLESQPWTEY